MTLCQLAADWAGEVPAGGYMVEEKRDGFRCLYMPGIDGRRRLFTRNGMPIEGCEHILATLSRFENAAGLPLFIDGELVVGGSLAATKAWVERGWRHGGSQGTFYAFDVLDHAEWLSGGSDVPLWQRKARLVDLGGAIGEEEWEWRDGARGPDDPSAVQILADGWAETAADVLAEANRVWASGGEGIMAKRWDAPYRRNRNDAWQKVKRENATHWLRAA